MSKEMIEKIIVNEGGLVDNPNDTGKMTYKGISRRWWPDWKGWKNVDSAIEISGGSLKKANVLLNNDDCLHNSVIEFYKINFWDKFKGDQMPEILAFNVCDFAVNSGVKVAVKQLQRCLGVASDGSVGKMTLNALGCVNDLESLIYDFNDLRMEFLGGLDGWQYFGRGWTNRVNHNNQFTEEYFK